MEEEKEVAMRKSQFFAKQREPHMNTVPRLFWSRVHEWGDKTAMREKEYGVWKDISWKKYGEFSKYVALGLVHLGLKKGDRVAIISTNIPQWLYGDMGILAAGGVTVGVYTSSSAKQIAHVMRDSGARFAVIEDEEQLDKMLEIRDALSQCEKIFVIDQEGLRGFSDPLVMPFDELLALGNSLEKKQPTLLEKLLLKTEPEDLAILIYTSGTTGPPKGSMISHQNLFAIVEAWILLNPGFMNDEVLTFLPLSHVLERLFSGIVPMFIGSVCNFAEDMATVPQDIREVSPTLFFAVPRIWEKFYSSLVLRMKDSTPFEKLAYKWAMKIGRKVSVYRVNLNKPPLYLAMVYKLAQWAVLNNLKKFLGLDRVRYCVSGAAPISSDLLAFYQSLGMNIREAYGLTETTGAAATHYAGEYKHGTVGKPLPGIQIKIAEDGEIYIKSRTVFMGYYKDSEMTNETIVDGWLHTGDVGRVDEDGHLVITDRKKDIIITAGGKNITPSEIENQLKFSPYINDAVVIGDRRKFLSCLIMIDDENVMRYAQDNRIPFTTYSSLTKTPEVVNLIQKEVNKVNRQLAQVESIKKFRLIDIQLTEDDDEITPTMKLKRKFISEKFRDQIEEMYRS